MQPAPLPRRFAIANCLSVFCFWAAVSFWLTGCTSGTPHTSIRQLKSGDIIFQQSLSDQSHALALATGSTYTHMGVVLVVNGKYLVFEATKTVRLTPLEAWIKQGKYGRYSVKRLKKDTQLTPAQEAKAKSFVSDNLGKNYDSYFNWSDNTMYCSELIWKMYKHVGNIELCKTRKLSDFNLNHSVVSKKLKERYGSAIPINETVVAPSDIYMSPLLTDLP